MRTGELNDTKEPGRANCKETSNKGQDESIKEMVFEVVVDEYAVWRMERRMLIL